MQFLYLQLILILLCSGCMQQEDIYGCYGSGKTEDQMTIITPEYLLTIPAKDLENIKNKGVNINIYKSNYTLQKLYNGYYIKSSYWFCLKEFLFIPYWDTTVWYLGFIPIGKINIHFYPKIPYETALEYLKSRNLDYDMLENLPIVNTYDGKYFLIPDKSLPKIMLDARANSTRIIRQEN